MKQREGSFEIHITHKQKENELLQDQKDELSKEKKALTKAFDALKKGTRPK